MAEAIRTALCDDHRVVRSGLRRLLADEPDIEVVGEAGTADEAVALAQAERPDVFIMDQGLPGASGIEATRRLRLVSPATRVLMLTVHDDVAYLRAAFQAGAVGYLVKDAADVELVEAVRALAAGRQYVHPSLGAALLAPEAAPARPQGPGGVLSEREMKVLRLVARGMTSAQIAERLVVSIRTVETHRAHIQHKLGVGSRAELFGFAQEHGLLDEGDAAP